MRKRWLPQWLAVLALLTSAGIAGAVPDKKSEKPVSTGGSVDARVQERARMRIEYEQMREKRADALARAREEASGRSGSLVPGWRGPNGERASDLVDEADAKPQPVRTEGIRRIEGSSKFFIYLAIGLLGLVLFMKFRGRRAAAG